ncbi:MAG: pyrroline-5-carboxylate reductase [Candidatus Omnitrophica bacterium]|nr:pyrroline-5-carboxylate reductase [Candidatus Omnitrophota bacterium]MCF7877312.1 pyrroline-5-carboxylate reductase [Candidatus Omnitrophota bacterium]MCF7878304.1 pyrroline-5-carboxylate reductase [Candidatus Omnitrophota bacterium]MCF7892769.1 pyrroline-5-carboxylate reductase [Candidatus Omnitrophota bacterium]
MKKQKIIGVVGLGTMGAACAKNIADFSNYKILAYDKNKNKQPSKTNTAKNIKELIRKSQLLFLAIKPQDLDAFLIKNRDIILAVKPLLISILAGVSLKSIEKALPGIKVIRVMPNLAVQTREAVSFIAAGKFVKEKELKEVKGIFSLLGGVFESSEKNMDKITALSGSGPGFIYYFMRSFYSTAIKMGFNKKEARRIVAQTFQGASKLASESDQDFSKLVKNVASRGGTTEAGISFFDKKQLSQNISKGIFAAYERAKKISLGSKKEKK